MRRVLAGGYDAAVAELNAGLPCIPDLPWESLSHRQVLAELATQGWVPCGVGDWADVAEVHRRIPRERMRYALDIPYIARENSTAEVLALRKAWARADGHNLQSPACGN